MLAFVTTLGFERTVNQVGKDPALVGNPFDLSIEPTGAPPERIEALLRSDPGVATWFTATSRRATTAGQGTFQVRALGGDVAGAKFKVRDGRQMSADGEATVGYGLLRRLGLHVGDRMDVVIDGHPASFTVVGWYAVSEDSGEILQISLADLRQLEPDAAPGTYLVSTTDSSTAADVAARLRSTLGLQAEVRLIDRSLDELDAFRAVFQLLTAIVLLIGLISLAATIALGLREHLRDLAVLKTIGFTPAQVSMSVASSATVLGLAAVIVGLPLGLAAQRLLLDSLGRSAGWGPGLALGPAPLALALTLAIILALTALIGVLAARRAARSEVSTVLREE